MASIPTSTPTVIPTSKPSVHPSSFPSQFPTKIPTILPTSMPTVKPVPSFWTTTNFIIGGAILVFAIALFICISRVRAFGNSAYFRHKNSGRGVDEEILLDNHRHLMEMAAKVHKEDMIRAAKLAKIKAKNDAKARSNS